MTAVLPGAVVVTRPRHPLEGRELRVLGGMAARESGAAAGLARWQQAADPGGVDRQHADGGAGQGGESAGTLGSVADLLAASVLVSAFSARDRDEREQAARKPPAKEDNRAACSAQSAAGPGSGATPDLLARLPGPQVAAAITLLGGLIAKAGQPGASGDE